MDLRIFTEPQQGATYDDLLAVARATEELGYDAFFRSDHYLHMSGDGTPGPHVAEDEVGADAFDALKVDQHYGAAKLQRAVNADQIGGGEGQRQKNAVARQPDRVTEKREFKQKGVHAVSGK